MGRDRHWKESEYLLCRGLACKVVGLLICTSKAYIRLYLNINRCLLSYHGRSWKIGWLPRDPIANHTLSSMWRDNWTKNKMSSGHFPEKHSSSNSHWLWNLLRFLPVDANNHLIKLTLYSARENQASIIWGPINKMSIQISSPLHALQVREKLGASLSWKTPQTTTHSVKSYLSSKHKCNGCSNTHSQ